MKKIISLLLIVALFVLSVPVYSSAATSGGFTYTVVSETDKTCKITAYSGSSKNVIVPAKLDGYKVIALDILTFYSNRALTVELPETVSSVNAQAFNGLNSTVNYISVVDSSPYYSSIDGILYNKSQTEIVCFPAGRADKSYIVPEGVTSVASYAFYNSSLVEIFLPKTLESIGTYTFNSCDSLKNIIIPENVVSIGASAFRSCKALETVSMSDSVTFIDVAAFYGCNLLKSINLSNNISIINGGVFTDCYSLEQISFPQSLTKICSQAFYGCDSLVELKIPDSVSVIESQVFASCDNLKKVLLPENIIELPDYLFNRCKALKYVYVPNSVTSIDTDAFNNCPNLTIYGYSGSYGESFAGENEIPFVSLDNIKYFNISQLTPQIRFQRNEDGSYAEKFDVRTRASISDEDFETYIGATNDEAILNIKNVGFVYSTNLESFSTEEAQKVAKGETVSGYVNAPVKNIQDAEGYYMFTCLITDVPSTDTNYTLISYAYICVEDADGNEVWYFMETQADADFNSLYTTYYPVACEKYGWKI